MLETPIELWRNSNEELEPEIGQEYKFDDSGVSFKFVEFDGQNGTNCEHCAFFNVDDFPCPRFCCDPEERTDGKTAYAVITRKEIVEKTENPVESFGNLDDNNLRKCCKDLEELYKQRENLSNKIEDLKHSVKDLTLTLKQIEERIFSILDVGCDNYKGEYPLFGVKG